MSDDRSVEWFSVFTRLEATFAELMRLDSDQDFVLLLILWLQGMQFFVVC